MARTKRRKGFRKLREILDANQKWVKTVIDDRWVSWGYEDKWEVGSKEWYKHQIVDYHRDRNHWSIGIRPCKYYNKKKARQDERQAIHKFMHGKTDDVYFSCNWGRYEDIWGWD